MPRAGSMTLDCRHCSHYRDAGPLVECHTHTRQGQRNAVPGGGGFSVASARPCRQAGGPLMQQLIKHPQATFLLRVRGESMKGAGNGADEGAKLIMAAMPVVRSGWFNSP